jgi:hypothetical protein
MKIKTTLKYFMTIAVVGIVFTSCRKEKDKKDDDIETASSRDNALAEGTYNDAGNIADEASTGSVASYFVPNNNTAEEVSGETRSMMSVCATVTRDTIAVPHTITVDFGSTNCLCGDGRYRRGMINISYTGRYRDSASTHTITFTNYYVNDNKVSGTKTVVNNGHNSAGHLTFTITVNGQIDKATGGTVTWISHRTREWVVGENTLPWSDDVYLITGTASGTSSSSSSGTSTSFTVTITSPLRKEIGCRNFVSGKFDLTPSGKATRHVDFGNGACDNEATVTINGNVYTISLH